MQPSPHGLEQLVAVPMAPGLLSHLFLGQPYVAEAAAVVLITAVLERSLEKYADRGYRYVLFEAGHVAQNLNLAAAALGLGTCNLGGRAPPEHRHRRSRHHCRQPTRGRVQSVYSR